MRSSICAPHKDVEGAVMLVATQNNESLSTQRMKRVSDRYFVGENAGTMSSLRTGEASAPR
jgi:hypothetical protein